MVSVVLLLVFVGAVVCGVDGCGGGCVVAGGVVVIGAVVVDVGG